MEEDLEGYLDWLSQAEMLSDRNNLTFGKDATEANSLKVDVGKVKGDPVVMGLLKSTMFPLQQVLEGTPRKQAKSASPLLTNQKCHSI